MKKLIFAFTTISLLVSCGGKKDDGPTPQVCPEGAVDLGIVMTREDGTTYKLFWAKSNLSTSGLCANPEDYGDYYAWGDTEPNYTSQDPLSWKGGKTGFNRVSYKFRSSGDSYDNVKFSKYNTDESYGPVDNITELQRGEKTGETKDDAARAKLGGKWRMPTDAELEALRTQCTWTWTNDYNGTGVAGRIVTSNIEGYKDKSIFLPATGYWDGTYLYFAGGVGCYWSSSLDTVRPYSVWYLGFSSGLFNRCSGDRYLGQSVRPVSE